MITMLFRAKGKDPIKTRDMMDSFLQRGHYRAIKRVDFKKATIKYYPRKNIADEVATH